MAQFSLAAIPPANSVAVFSRSLFIIHVYKASGVAKKTTKKPLESYARVWRVI